MRTISSLLGITAIVTGLIGVAACGSDDAGDGSGGSGNTGNSSGDGGSGNDGGSSNAGPGSGGSGASGGSGSGSGGSGTPASYCAKSCTAAADCCNGLPDCPGDAYPNNPTCEEGICKGAQCADDAECTFNGALPDYKCLTLDAGGSDFKFCSEGCSADGDCTAPLTCSGEDANGVKYCSTAPGPGCMSDADCTPGYGDTCNTDTGACGCSDDTECTGMGVDTCVDG
jgi:hypothetical protein